MKKYLLILSIIFLSITNILANDALQYTNISVGKVNFIFSVDIYGYVEISFGSIYSSKEDLFVLVLDKEERNEFRKYVNKAKDYCIKAGEMGNLILFKSIGTLKISDKIVDYSSWGWKVYLVVFEFESRIIEKIYSPGWEGCLILTFHLVRIKGLEEKSLKKYYFCYVPLEKIMSALDENIIQAAIQKLLKFE